MTTEFRLTRSLLERAREDLRRPHAFAHERVGFFACRFGALPPGADMPGGLLILGHDYHSVDDAQYIDDPRYGAVIDGAAFRAALQRAYSHPVGMFHAHLHEHAGTPHPSRTDLTETREFVPDFFNARPELPHGAVILSADRLSGRYWTPATRLPHPITRVRVVGAPLTVFEEAA